MPVTVYPAAHPARALRPYHRPVQSSNDLLRETCADEWRRCHGVIQSSFDRSPLDALYPMSNGFVRTCIRAYSSHHHLCIRPEDVWFAILNQLSFYINAHAEELREFFVSHKDQKPLTVIEVGTIRSVDFGPLAVRMTHEIEKNVNDPELRTWIMPDFSTTTNSDHVIAAILFMGAMQKYFTYGFELMCGIPSVTVLGERADWEKIRSRLDKIDQLGEEPAQFAALLKTVLDFFVKTFDEPEHPGIVHFWGRIAHEIDNMSGPTWLSGWITAFCFWNAKGERLRGPPRSHLLACTSMPSSQVDLPDLHKIESSSTVLQPKAPTCKASQSNLKHETDEIVAALLPRLDLDRFHTVDMQDIPNGYSSVPVTVNDNETIYHTRMVAGSVGMQAWSSGQPIETSTGQNDDQSHRRGPDGENVPRSVQPQVGHLTGIDTIQPVSGWWMYEISAAAEAEWKEIQDMKSGAQSMREWAQAERKRKQFEDNQNKKVKRSKLREILDKEEANAKLGSTEKSVPTS